MDYNTNIQVIDEKEITILDLEESIKGYLGEYPNLTSIQRIYFDELSEYINNNK
jgi:hypothetical protein